MKSIGWVVIMLGLLVVAFLVVRDLGVLRGEREGKAVIEPLEVTKETAGLVQKNRSSLKRALEKIDE